MAESFVWNYLVSQGKARFSKDGRAEWYNATISRNERGPIGAQKNTTTTPLALRLTSPAKIHQRKYGRKVATKITHGAWENGCHGNGSVSYWGNSNGSDVTEYGAKRLLQLLLPNEKDYPVCDYFNTAPHQLQKNHSCFWLDHLSSSQS